MKPRDYAALLLLILFLGLAVSVHRHLWQQLDWDTLVALQATLPRSVDMPFSLLSLLGSAEVTTLIFLAMVWRARPEHRLLWLAAFALIAAIELVGKLLIVQPDLPDELRRYVFQVGMPSGKIDTRYSFPSGHAARTTFLLMLLAGQITSSRLQPSAKNLLYALLVSITVLMLVSRVYLADHWLTDVLGGVLLGSAFALLGWGWKSNLPEKLARRIF